MARLRDLNLGRHLADPALKPHFVTPMFDIVAPRYDDFTRLFSFGMDRGWKAELVRRAIASVSTPAQVVDLACGTGDLAIAVASAVPRARVLGVDASQEMIAFARTRLSAEPADVASRITAIPGDLGAIPAATSSVDLVTAGYAFRNGPPLAESLREAARVLRPGGILASLDFYRPSAVVWRHLLLGYLRAAGNLVGWWWHREPIVYGYIAASIDAFVSAEEFTAALAGSGFENVQCAQRLGGGVALHVARRTGSQIDA
jgi:demethylmenaquinone methyltransferase/2-methoxy-6-polyprenyl-1,4-benzoquinol methylase